MSASEFDCVIIGGGIAGASLGYWLAPHMRSVILERESVPGYHATGRSAAVFMESYGPQQVRALSRASRGFLASPPAGFTDHPLLRRRGGMVIAQKGEEAELRDMLEYLEGLPVAAQWLDADQAYALVPALARDQIAAAVHEADIFDIDVGGLHQGYLRGFRNAGGVLQCDAQIQAISRSGGRWAIELRGRKLSAPLLVNAAGAWADEVASLAGVRPLGLQPRRRSAFVFRPPADMDCSKWPLCVGVREDWYFKPDAGLLLGSPANADDCAPQDVQPEAYDIALGIARIQAVTTLRIQHPVRTWAGLRTFSPDGDIVGGNEPAAPGFFWLAGQGGYGIQTSAAMGEVCAAWIRGSAHPVHAAECGVRREALDVARLRGGADLNH